MAALLGTGGAGAQEAKLIYNTYVFIPDKEAYYETVTCDPDGGNAAMLALPLPPKRFEKKFRAPIRSPDGKKIAFYGMPNKGDGFFVADADGTNVKRLATDPDGPASMISAGSPTAIASSTTTAMKNESGWSTPTAPPRPRSARRK